MAEVISFTVKVDIATQNPSPNLNDLLIRLGDTVSQWSKQNDSKDIFFDSKMKLYHLSDKKYDQMETCDQAYKRFQEEQKLQNKQDGEIVDNIAS